MPAIAHQNKILGNGALVDDTTTSADKTWSSSKINTELGLKANSADVPTKAQITNPNLLDNPWFTVNQRGQNSYTGLNNVYFLDRWKVDGDMTEYTFSPTSNGLEISCVGAPTHNRFFLQKIENNVLEGEKTYTISVLIRSNVSTRAELQVRNNGSFVFGSGFDVTTGWQVVSFTGTMPSSLSNVDVRIYPNYSKVADATVYIRAIKLEKGSISTLAMDTIPNYASELLKCQRYFIRTSIVNTGFLGIAVAQNANYALVSIPVMNIRTTPTVTLNGSLLAGTIAVENMQYYSRLATSIMLRLNATGLFTTNNSYSVTASGASTIDISADL